LLEVSFQACQCINFGAESTETTLRIGVAMRPAESEKVFTAAFAHRPVANNH
jgi:hypothetical protein